MKITMGSVACILVLAAGCTQPEEPGGTSTPITRAPSSSSLTTSTPSSSSTTTTTTSSTSTTPPPTVHVDVKSNYYDPPGPLGGSHSVSNGTVATFELHQGSHTVTIHRTQDPAGQYVHDETLATPGQETTYTFSEAGTYEVFCRFHGAMKATFQAS